MRIKTDPAAGGRCRISVNGEGWPYLPKTGNAADLISNWLMAEFQEEADLAVARKLERVKEDLAKLNFSKDQDFIIGPDGHVRLTCDARDETDFTGRDGFNLIEESDNDE